MQKKIRKIFRILNTNKLNRILRALGSLQHEETDTTNL